MKQRTVEWIEKVEGDMAIAMREMASPEPVWDGVCFHAQQCREGAEPAMQTAQKVRAVVREKLGLPA